MYNILSSRCKAKLISMVEEAEANGWRVSGGHQHVVYEEVVSIDYKIEMSHGIVPEGWSPEENYRTTGCWSQSMVKED